jgi:hypothetical protein
MESTTETPQRTECTVCGSTHGPAILQPGGWECVRHLPRMGERRGLRS